MRHSRGRTVVRAPQTGRTDEPKLTPPSPWHPVSLFRRWKPQSYLILLLLVLIAPFAQVLASPDGQVLGHPACDNPASYYYFNDYAGQCWRHGIIPLWNPHIMLGMPFVGEGQAAVFHPLSILFVFLGTGAAINWLIASAVILTGLFFYGYLRALGLGEPAAWCGAVTWSFSNLISSRIYAGHLNILLALISIPLIMMLWEKYRTCARVVYLAGIALAYALMILAWYPFLLYIFSLFFLLYVLVQSGLAITDAASARREGRSILLLGVFSLLGVGAGAIQLFPGLDFVSESFRKKATLEFCGTLSFPPENFLTLLAPRFFGTKFTSIVGRYWGRNYFWEMWLYLGILPLLLAAAGAWAAPRGRRAVLLGCGAFFLIVGLGKYSPLFPWLYRHVPLFHIFRGSGKYLTMTLFCLVTLSAYGFESLFGETDELKRRRLRRIVLATAGALLLIMATVLIVFLRNPEGAGSRWQALLNRSLGSGEIFVNFSNISDLMLVQTSASEARQSLLGGMLLAAFSAGLLLLTRSPRLRRYLFPLAAVLILADLLPMFLAMQRTFTESITQYPTEYAQVASRYPYPPRILDAAHAMPNIAMHYGFSTPFGTAGNTLRRYNDFINRAQGIDLTVPQSASRFKQFSPTFDMLAFDATAIPAPEAPPGTKPLCRLGDKILVPYEAVHGKKSPRAFLAAAPHYVARPEEAFEYVFKDGVDVLASPAIEGEGGAGGAATAAGALERDETVRFVTYRAHRIELEVQARRPRELVLCSMFEHNWTAQVNGVKAPIRPANYVFRAVQVPQGTSRVVFRYQPVAFYWGAGLTALSFAALLGIVWGARRRGKGEMQS